MSHFIYSLLNEFDIKILQLSAVNLIKIRKYLATGLSITILGS